jgi:hypothetical protein
MPDHVDRAAVLAGLEPFGSALVRAVDELDHASREASPVAIRDGVYLL